MQDNTRSLPPTRRRALHAWTSINLLCPCTPSRSGAHRHKFTHRYHDRQIIDQQNHFHYTIWLVCVNLLNTLYTNNLIGWTEQSVNEDFAALILMTIGTHWPPLPHISFPISKKIGPYLSPYLIDNMGHQDSDPSLGSYVPLWAKDEQQARPVWPACHRAVPPQATMPAWRLRHGTWTDFRAKSAQKARTPNLIQNSTKHK